MRKAVDVDLALLKSRVRDVPDFPKPGILFRDITPLLLDPAATRVAVQAMGEPFRGQADVVLGVEARGFILGALVAQDLGVGFVPVRKPGKLPAKVLRESYELEYGKDSIEMHADAVEPGQRVLIVDDLIATGGTAGAACALAERAGARVTGLSFLIELRALGGRRHLGDRRVHVVLEY